ncbi:hypothetical protein PUNSTDRAFT_45059 [Punctularia strigosozonata HHB-11173 SS5]|uniref:uncharacterized protein n=1 Tax=Punctularia strigosozonata (strain HHB-11173) TaxID=741275 RepID=UPI00044167A4|nr:uncharacterized protein PUNSTDRAFT_45059 [Punctularia strigosozonata HHB-11173 SS5]EIN08596.1 hypothetical protein PUNSTDRAFT_45059 [Punctularia strigosozonata HHB-11173 SS5]
MPLINHLVIVALSWLSSPLLTIANSDPDTLNYAAFTQTATYSIANQLGFFYAFNLSIAFSSIPNSTFGYAQLLAGATDVLTGTIDNAVNLRFNSNENITVLGQLDAGPDIVVAGVAGIDSVLGLRGKALMVDSPVSGYAFMLRKVLSLFGLRLENGDYTFQTVGATTTRFADLVAGSLPDGTPAIATILTYPFTAQLGSLPTDSSSAPPTILARVSDFIQPLTSTAFTISGALAPSKRPLLVRFLAAFHAASLFLADPSNRICSIRAIAAQLNVSLETAEAEYLAATDPVTGEVGPTTNFTVSRQGLLNVIDVRGQFAGGFGGVDIDGGEGFNFAEAIEPGVGQLVDYTIRDEALALANPNPSSFTPSC